MMGTQRFLQENNDSDGKGEADIRLPLFIKILETIRFIYEKLAVLYAILKTNHEQGRKMAGRCVFREAVFMCGFRREESLARGMIRVMK
ncbi:MAG: hypothetical protein LUI13_03690 [Lachnospiraceae bacterium]|nr:hypothetical protein [Lachnospiraceae bacterium]